MFTINKFNISVFTIWLFAISAIIGIYLGNLQWFITKTPLNLLLGATLLFINLPINTARKLSVWLLAFVIGMAVEIAGVQTGSIFGEYYYGENLGAKFMGVPYLIGVNWAVLAFLTVSISKQFSNKLWTSAIIGASLMVGLDFFLEPMARVFDFWHFANDQVPMQNYIAWFFISLFLQVVIQKTTSIKKTSFSFHLFFSQVIFFGLCYLIVH